MMSIVHPSSLLAIGLDLAVRSTILLAIALVARRILGKHRPMIGSAIGQAGLLGLLLLPASAWFGPTLSLPLARAEATVPATDRPALAIEVVEHDRTPPGPWDDDPASSDPAPSLATAPKPLAVAPSKPRPAHQPSTGPAVDVASVVVATYAMVTLAMLARLLGSMAGVARVRRSSVPVDDPAWLGALDRLGARLGIRRPVLLARSRLVGVPAVVGWLRPLILLPSRSTSVEPDEHAEAILLHELAHVRRGDYAWNVLLRVSEAIYWPHPLAWLLGRAVAESRERACDAYCVHQLGGPSGYRAALLAMAEGLARHPSPSLGLAMAARSRLARRVMAIDRGQAEARCLPRRSIRVAILALALGATAIIGPSRITRAKPQDAPVVIVPQKTEKQAAEPAKAATVGKVFKSTAILGPAKITRAKPQDVPVAVVPQEPVKNAAEPAKAPALGKVFKLRVVAAADGKPVPKADVRVWMRLRDDDWRKTDEEGRIDLVYATGPDDQYFGVDVWGDGYAQQRHNWGNDPKAPIPDEATIKLQPGESLGGLVQDEEGRPVAGATVYLFSHNFQRKDPAELLYDLRAITGPDGRWRTGGAPQMTGNLMGFYITHPDFISDREYAAGREKPPIDLLRAGKAVSVMKTGVPIEGRVLSGDGKPVAGALVISTEFPGNLFNGLEKYSVRTDAEGRFRTGQVKDGEWHLVIKAKGYAPAARKLRVGTAIPGPGRRTAGRRPPASRKLKVDDAIPFEEIRLEAPHSFRARVVDPKGKPIVGAFVNVDTWGRYYRCLGVYLYTDLDGRVRWDDAPADGLLLTIDHATHLGLFDHRARAGEDLAFTLKPSLAIAGIVRDAETRKGVEKAEVEYGAVDPVTGKVANWRKSPKLGWTWFSSGYLNVRFAVEADAYKIRIIAKGYEPFTSRDFRREEQVVRGYDVTLVPSKPGKPGGPAATVVRPDGRPLAGARVSRGRRTEDLSLQDGQFTNPNLGRESLTDAEGKFAIPDPRPSALVLILGDDCWAYANAKALLATPRLVARPYARVEGRFLVGDRPKANWPVELTGMIQDDSSAFVLLSYNQTATTDAEGRFTFEKVLAMPGLRVTRDDPRKSPTRATSMGEPVHAEDGKTSVVTFGGKGRPVIGRINPPLGWDKPVDFTDQCRVSIESDRCVEPVPLDLVRGKTNHDTALSNWMRTWPHSPEGRDYADSRVGLSAAVAPDGSFRVDDVPPGDYRVTIRVNDADNVRQAGPFNALGMTLSIPPIPGDRTDEPVDLGPLRLKPRAKLEPGDPAPSIEVTTVDGRKLAIPGDFAGKYLLLDFGTTWQLQARFQVYRMNDVFARFGKHDRFAMVSLLMDADRDESRAFVAGKGQPWPQAIVGAPSNPISDAYGPRTDQFDSPDAILIGPDGRIVERDLFYPKMGEAIAKALGLKEPAPK